MTADTLDRVTVLLIEARDQLYEQIDRLGDDELNTRAQLDQIIATRTALQAKLNGLEQVIAGEPEPAPAAQAQTGTMTVELPQAALALINGIAVPAIPSTAATVTPPAGSRGRKPSIEYTVVAEWITEAEAAGTYTTATMAAHFGVPLSTAKNWRTRCRDLGLLSAELAAGPTPGDAGQAVEEVPLEEIAATYLEAVSADRKPIQTLVDRYDIARHTAQAWVNAARDAGHLPPKNEPQIPTEAPMQVRKHVNTGGMSL